MNKKLFLDLDFEYWLDSTIILNDRTKILINDISKSIITIIVNNELKKYNLNDFRKRLLKSKEIYSIKLSDKVCDCGGKFTSNNHHYNFCSTLNK